MTCFPADYVYSLNTDIFFSKATTVETGTMGLTCLGNKYMHSLLPIFFFPASKFQPFYHPQPIWQVQNLEAAPHIRQGQLF